MKKGDDGFFELTVFATVHEVINNEKMKAEAYQIRFKTIVQLRHEGSLTRSAAFVC